LEIGLDTSKGENDAFFAGIYLLSLYVFSQLRGRRGRSMTTTTIKIKTAAKEAAKKKKIEENLQLRAPKFSS
jgi:hypothetical protein